MSNSFYNIELGKSRCAVDLGDGSERAEYVDQDYILSALSRPHRCVNLMYTYYPLDKQWPARISEACADIDVKFAWDYPYDDYFPYGANGEPFNQMRDIRRHGQDVMLTLTIDIRTPEDHLRRIATQLKPYGRMKLRINHECNGNWFTHNKRYSYEEIGAFFAKFAGIIKEIAPNIQTVFCAGLKENDAKKVPYEDEFIDAYKACDVYSCDKYLALHWGWPYDIAEVGGNSIEAQNLDHIYEVFNNTACHLESISGKKEFILGEFNVDGDVTGAFLQADTIRRFYDKVESDTDCRINAISMYQFRDRGRLGLEIENPNNPKTGIAQPLLETYREIIGRECFMPPITSSSDERVTFPKVLRWGSSEDASGIAVMVHLEQRPVFCEAVFDEEPALMIQFAKKWFYKAPGVARVDLMSAFFDAKSDGQKDMFAAFDASKGIDIPLNIFATPADGTNECGNDDECLNYYVRMNNEPKLRIRYSPCLSVQ